MRPDSRIHQKKLLRNHLKSISPRGDPLPPLEGDEPLSPLAIFGQLTLVLQPKLKRAQIVITFVTCSFFFIADNSL